MKYTHCSVWSPTALKEGGITHNGGTTGWHKPEKYLPLKQQSSSLDLSHLWQMLWHAVSLLQKIGPKYHLTIVQKWSAATESIWLRSMETKQLPLITHRSHSLSITNLVWEGHGTVKYYKLNTKEWKSLANCCGIHGKNRSATCLKEK